MPYTSVQQYGDEVPTRKPLQQMLPAPPAPQSPTQPSQPQPQAAGAAPAPGPNIAPQVSVQTPYQPQRQITPVQAPPDASYDPAQAAIQQTKQAPVAPQAPAPAPMTRMLSMAAPFPNYDGGGGDQNLQAQIDASLAANPQGTFGPSPSVDYSSQLPPGVAGAGPQPGGGGAPGAGVAQPNVASIYDSDPELLRFLGNKEGLLGKASAQRLQSLRNILIQLGDPALAKSLLGESDPILGAISEDPDKSTSSLAELARNYRNLTRDVEENLNNENLYYSGHRQGRVLPELANDQLRERAKLLSGAQGQISDLDKALLDFENDLGWQETQVREGAYGRAKDEALATGIGADEAANPADVAAQAGGAAPLPYMPTPGPNIGMSGEATPEAIAALLALINKERTNPIGVGSGSRNFQAA